MPTYGSCVDWFAASLPEIYHLVRMNAAMHNRCEITYHDVLIGIKRYKYGYEGFDPPPVVVSVYLKVFDSNF